MLYGWEGGSVGAREMETWHSWQSPKPTPKSFPMSPNRGVGISGALPPIPAKEIPKFSPGLWEPGPLLVFSLWNLRLAEAGGGCCARVPPLLQEPSEGWAELGKEPWDLSNCHELGLGKGMDELCFLQ